MLFLVLVTSTKHYWVISAERRRRLPTALLRRNGWVKCQISPATVKFLKRGPSWLTFLGHMKDSLWSMDLFRCESASLRTKAELCSKKFRHLRGSPQAFRPSSVQLRAE